MTAVYVSGGHLASPHYAPWERRDSAESGQEDEEGPSRQLTPFERLTRELSQDEKVAREVALGKRVGFYRIRGELGSGNFSQVKLGIHALTKEKVAVKILDKTKLDQKTQRLLSREISSMEKLHHPNIIRLYEVVETLSKLYLVMEYAGGGELFGKVSAEGRLSEPDSKLVFSQIVSAVKHMHEKQIIHRDLKAENVFYASAGCVKVGDFGFSTASGRGALLATFCGSPPYAAPELFRDEHYAGAGVDVWALGVLLFFMVTGAMPFRAENMAKLKRSILDGAYRVPAHVSEPCARLLRGVLQPRPAERLGIEGILRHEWLQGVPSPAPLEPFPLDPRHLSDSRALRDEEREVRGALQRLGITEDHIRNNQGRDARSAVTGVYRIVLHRVQRRSARDSGPATALPGPPDAAPLKKGLGLYRGIRHTSKFCSIL